MRNLLADSGLVQLHKNDDVHFQVATELMFTRQFSLDSCYPLGWQSFARPTSKTYWFCRILRWTDDFPSTPLISVAGGGRWQGQRGWPVSGVVHGSKSQCRPQLECKEMIIPASRIFTFVNPSQSDTWTSSSSISSIIHAYKAHSTPWPHFLFINLKYHLAKWFWTWETPVV